MVPTESLRQSLQAAEMREVEYEAALTMRVLAAVETDPREQELLARSAAQIFAKLKVDWTPDLLSAPRVLADADGREPASATLSPDLTDIAG